MVKKIKGLLSLPDLASNKPNLWPALYLLLLAVSLKGYLPYHQANFWLGIIALVIFFRYPVGEKGGYRFLFASIVFMGIYLILPVKTVSFLALMCALLFSIEAIAGRLHLAVLPIIFLMSPVANYISQVFSFPVRLQLSDWAAKMLVLTGHKAEAIGNGIALNGTIFSVDDACIGLSMLVCSMLMGLISIQLYEIKLQKRLPVRFLPIVLLYFLFFNIVSNLLRIFCLVYFQLLPNTLAHELTGLGCWIVYGIATSIWLVKMMVLYLGKPQQVQPNAITHQTKLPYYQITQFGLLMLMSATVGSGVGTEILSKESLQIPVKGYKVTPLQHQVTRLQNEESLIYIKPILGFYSTDHNPSICWRGSGYAFKEIREENKFNMVMYTAKLEKEGATLFTAWWYESGNHRTIHQWLWRWKSLRQNKQYSLINITSASLPALEHAVNKWITGEKNTEPIMNDQQISADKTK